MAQASIRAGGLRKFVGQIESRQHSHSQRVDGVTLRGHGAHLGVDIFCDLANMLRIMASEVIGLIVDGDGRVCQSLYRSFCWPLPASQFERIELGKKPLYALPHMIALTSQGADFCIQLVDQRSLLAELRLDFSCALLCRNAGSAVPF